MNNYTMNTYEVKRDLVNFSKKISKGLNKPTSKFVMDMIYGISKSKSSLISEIYRSLEEKINLNYTIERLCDNLNKQGFNVKSFKANVANRDEVNNMIKYCLDEFKSIDVIVNNASNSTFR